MTIKDGRLDLNQGSRLVDLVKTYRNRAIKYFVSDFKPTTGFYVEINVNQNDNCKIHLGKVEDAHGLDLSFRYEPLTRFDYEPSFWAIVDKIRKSKVVTEGQFVELAKKVEISLMFCVISVSVILFIILFCSMPDSVKIKIKIKINKSKIICFGQFTGTRILF